jgi:hypothetical protein
LAGFGGDSFTTFIQWFQSKFGSKFRPSEPAVNGLFFSGNNGNFDGLFFGFGCGPGASAPVNPWSKPGSYPVNEDDVDDGRDGSINGFRWAVDDAGFGVGACTTLVDSWSGPGGAGLDDAEPDDSFSVSLK